MPSSEYSKSLDEAERQFAFEEAIEAINQPNRSEPAIVGFQDIVNVINGRNMQHAAEVFARANRDVGFRRDLEMLLRRAGGSRQPALAAASSGQLSGRNVGEISLEFLESRTDPGECYVVILLPDSGVVPGHISVEVGDGCIVHPLPEAVKNRVQLLLAADDPLLIGLRDHSATVTIW